MNQPITEPTNYCYPIDSLRDCLDFEPGESEFIDNLIAEYGENLEKLTKKEKLFMLSSFANKIAFEEPAVVSGDINQLVEKVYCSDISLFDLFALMGALSEQIRWGCYAETSTQQRLQHPVVLCPEVRRDL